MFYDKTPVIHTGVLFFALLVRSIFFFSVVYYDHATTVYCPTIY